MRPCKHENADHLFKGDILTRWDDNCAIGEVVKFEQFRCLDCGHWIPLGPASDTEATAAEVRAAELAARVEAQRARGKSAFLTDIGFDGAEVAGWIEHQYDSEKLPEQFGEHAGYLAHIIATHTSGTEEG